MKGGGANIEDDRLPDHDQAGRDGEGARDHAPIPPFAVVSKRTRSLHTRIGS